MEGMKPNLDVFDNPRFSEWRRGDNAWCGVFCFFHEIVDTFRDLFGFIRQ